MTDLDMMTETQMWLMGVAAIVLWTVTIRAWLAHTGPRRTRHTYTPPTRRGAQHTDK